MKKTLLLRYGELFLKGDNKSYFEQSLIKNIKYRIKEFDGVKITKISGRFLITNYNDSDEELIISKLQKVFGLHSVSPTIEVESKEEIINKIVSDIRINAASFKIDVNRADKRFALSSMQYAAKLGGLIIDNHPNIKVNLKTPEQTIYIDIRENGCTYIFYKIIKCAGGMPVGTSAPGLLLLSGGIDSPVAGYLMSKRGMQLHAIHFHSFPYTSEAAKQKVLTLAKILTEYTGHITMHVVPFTAIQESIHKNCSPEFMITLMRRLMMRISERIAKQYKLKAIITGESVAQVASQTVESILVTNSVIEDLPVFRPLIGTDKEDIIEIAKKINTFETSVLPYEDCCTVFLPEHPVTKPRMDKVLLQEKKLNIEELITKAMNEQEIIHIK